MLFLCIRQLSHLVTVPPHHQGLSKGRQQSDSVIRLLRSVPLNTSAAMTGTANNTQELTPPQPLQVQKSTRKKGTTEVSETGATRAKRNRKQAVVQTEVEVSLAAEVSIQALSQGEAGGAEPAGTDSPKEAVKVREVEEGPQKNTKRRKKTPPPPVPFYSPSMRPAPYEGPALRLLSWNVAGLRGLAKKDPQALARLLEAEQPDVLCLQETKLQHSHVEEMTGLAGLAGLSCHWNCSTSRLGYSGVATLCREEPLSIRFGIEAGQHDEEGRVVTVELADLYVVNVYVPNSGDGLKRLDYRVGEWDKAFSQYVKDLERKKPVVVTGDMNCAHKEIDIHNPKGNLRSAGFTQEERDSFTDCYINQGFVDTFRAQHPGVAAYTYYSYKFQCRAKNKGWRLDYFLVSHQLSSKVHDSYILQDVVGSDHLPLGLVLKK